MRLRTTMAAEQSHGSHPLLFALALYFCSTIAALVTECQPRHEYISYRHPVSNGYRGFEQTPVAENRNMAPNELANIFSRITYTWMTPLLEKGYRQPLKLEDLWELGFEYQPSTISEKFRLKWEHEFNSSKPSLLRATIRTFGGPWFIGFVLKLISDIVSFLSPILLSRLIEFIGDFKTAKAQPVEYGYFYAVALFAVVSIQTLSLEYHWYQNLRIKCMMMAGFSAAVYRKTIKLSNDSRHRHNVGGIITYMSVDALRISDFSGNFSHDVWSAPLQIALALYFLYQTIGWSMLAGVAVMVFSIPTSSRLSRSMHTLNKLLMGYRDTRMRIMDEVLSGIKVVKLYAWEIPFVKRINDVRITLELATIRRYGILQAVFSFVMTLVPFAVSFATFGVYSLFDGVSHGPLTPRLVFVSLTLFNMLRTPLTKSASIVPNLLEAMVSFQRIYDFLLAEEVDFLNVDHAPYNRESPLSSHEDVLVSVDNGSFKWSASDELPAVSNLNIRCRRTELVAVIGTVGSGKSSLVSAILGEMEKCSGSVSIRGNIAYVPQQPWIVNATLRDNIIFGSQFDPDLYYKVVDACALGPDLESLPARDLTEIGEKGINLSGGQKARVSLARAVYSRADVYILDDPLAAVDSHVAKHIYTHVLGPRGMLKSRARVLVTNVVQCLYGADHVLMLRDGAVVEQGSIYQVMERKGLAYNFVRDFANLDSDSDKDTNSKGSQRPDRNAGKRPSSTTSSHGSSSGTSDCYDQTISPSGKSASSLATLPAEPLQKTSHTGAVSNNGTCPSRTQTEPAAAASSTSLVNNDLGRMTTTEINHEGKVEWSVYRTYAYACGLRNVSAFIAVLVSASVCSILANVWLMHWSSSNDNTGSLEDIVSTAQNTTIYYLSIYGLLGILSAALSLLQSFLLWAKCTLRASTKLHDSLLGGVLRSPMSFFDVTPLGRILNRFSSDVRGCDESLPRSISLMVTSLVGVFSAAAVICFATPIMLALTIPLYFVYKYLQQRYLFCIREMRRLELANKSPIYSHYQETISGLSTIRAYGQQSRFIDQNEERLGRYARVYYAYLALIRWLTLRLKFIGNVVMLFTAVFSVFMLHWYGYGSAGAVGLSITYALDIISALSWSIRSYTEVENMMIQLERMVEYSHLPSEAPGIVDDRRPEETWPSQGVVEFRNYSARYRDNLDLALKDMSFHVLPKQKIGIVGRTGAGKSSMTLALFRIIEAAGGQILIDGEDISKLGLYDVRSRLSIIPQDPMLFKGTVRKNLDPFGDYSDIEIWTALDHAHLAETIRAREGGLDFEVAQGGENFSVGQRQLVCLARALLRRSKVLILDEATAAIDNQTDHVIQQAIRSEFADCTVLTIAHRLNTVMDSDMILAIDRGVVVEYDTPANLLANKDSVFAKLVQETEISN
ncbi:hypothetical protein H4R99_005195 [Coemansia sp. RSA 1722]|nr:hypothetical protein H4R99_005195 [Coemansia sp. RSA 1722]